VVRRGPSNDLVRRPARQNHAQRARSDLSFGGCGCNHPARSLLARGHCRYAGLRSDARERTEGPIGNASHPRALVGGLIACSLYGMGAAYPSTLRTLAISLIAIVLGWCGRRWN